MSERVDYGTLRIAAEKALVEVVPPSANGQPKEFGGFVEKHDFGTRVILRHLTPIGVPYVETVVDQWGPEMNIRVTDRMLNFTFLQYIDGELVDASVTSFETGEERDVEPQTLWSIQDTLNSRP